MRERLEALLDAPVRGAARGDVPLVLRCACSRTRRSRPGVDPFLSPVTPADRLALLLERIDDLTLRRHEIRGNPAPLLASFVSRIDRLKDEMVSAADYRALRRAQG